MTPTTSAETSKMITELETKRTALNATITSTAERRKGAAVSAEFGDEEAKETLRKVTAEATEAVDALQNVEAAISQMKLLRDELAADEAIARELETAAAVDAAVDALLEVDDETDAALEHARELLQKRRALARAPILRKAKHKFAGALVVRDREIASSILAYFDFEMSHLTSGESFVAITRVADFDARHFGRQSPAQIERGKRPLSPFERAWKSNVDRVGWAGNGGSGHDSQIEHDKWVANGGGRKAVRDISKAWPASG
jgi:hypothetical protein